MKPIEFSSSLAECMTQFVAFKRVEGYDYTCGAYELSHFDRFLAERFATFERLAAEQLALYVEFTSNLNDRNRYNRLSIVRVFSRFMHALDPRGAVLGRIPVKRPSLPRFHLYGDAEIVALLEASLRLEPTCSLRPHCFHMLIGLLAVTGLRISEALGLDLRDLELPHHRLFVRNGKFGKERYVAIDPSTVRRLEAFLAIRRPYGDGAPTAPLFLDRAGRRLPYSQARETFATLRRVARIGDAADKPPRLHDLRHTYACNCLRKWRGEGVDVNAKLPLLATAMGHTKVEHTQIYLHVTPQQLEEGSERLRDQLNRRTTKGN